MIGIAILGLVLVVGLAGLVVYVVGGHAVRREQVDQNLHDPRMPTLEYAVPTGIDPAPVRAALEQAGYTTTVDSTAGPQLVLVQCPRGLDRERDAVRAAIESVDNSASDHDIPVPTNVRFRDEA